MDRTERLCRIDALLHEHAVVPGLNRSGFSGDQSHWAGAEAADSTSSNRMRAKSKFSVFGRCDGGHVQITPSDRRPSFVLRRSHASCRRPARR